MPEATLTTAAALLFAAFVSLLLLTVAVLVNGAFGKTSTTTAMCAGFECGFCYGTSGSRPGASGGLAPGNCQGAILFAAATTSINP
jgi:hypothetical protein